MNAIPFFKDLGTVVPFVANNKSSKELTAKGMVWRELYLRLTGQLTLTAANNTPANTLAGDEWASLTDITLRINGRDVLKRIDGPSLRWLQYYLYGVFPLKSLGQIGNNTIANPSFDSTLILPFWMPKSQNPQDFSLDTSKLSRIDLELTWGNFTSINSAATAFTVAPSVDVGVYEVANVGGSFARWNIFPISTVIAGASTNNQIKIPTGFMYRSFLIHDPSAIVTNIKIQSHPTEWINMPITFIRDVIGNARRNSVIPTAFSNTNWLAGAPADAIANFYYLDSVGHGADVESIDAFGLSEFNMLVDVSGAGTVTVFPSQLVVPRG
jgi:hypothetical protein